MTTDLKFILPFYFEATKKRDNEGFPQKFPFHLFFDKDLGIYRQKNSRLLKKILDEAYLRGSMLSGGMNDVVIGGPRVNEAFNFIDNNFLLKRTTTVLEIGCGEGQVLRKLARLGIQCIGLEPGPQVLQIEGKNLSIIKDFFPSKKVQGKYDLILHFGVLEHIDNPLQFLIDQKIFLNEKGSIILAVPNSLQDLEAGDISVFLHEHYNYFTVYGIHKLAKKVGLQVEKITKGKDGAFLYAKLSAQSSSEDKDVLKNPISDKKFRKIMQSFTGKLKKYFMNKKQSDVAIYCPLRSMNLLYNINVNDCRLIDDNKNLQDKFLPTFKRKIESFEDLKKNPPKNILIYSKTFGKIIKKKCMEAPELSGAKILTVDELNKK